MPAKPYITLVGGRLRQVLASVVGGTNGQAGDLVALDDTGRLDQSVMPTGIGADTFTGTAGEALAAGDFVAITSGGVVRASASTTGTDADGFVTAAFTNGATAAVVFLEGRNTALTGLTVGARYYLSDSTPGGLTSTPVSGTGKKHQYLGKAITTTSLAYEADDAILLA